MRYSGGHATKKASSRRFQTMLWAIVGAAALVMSACVPPTEGPANLRPVAVATSDVASGSAPLTVQFNSAGSLDPDGTIVSYRWNFGDGSPVSTDANPSHTYAAGGAYVATLTVTDNSAATGTATVTITVGASGNQAPTAVAAATTPATGKAPLSVSFSSAGSSDPDGSIVAYSWNWGDGTGFGTTANPSHTFTTAGTYVVSLTVTDNFGATGTATTTVTVDPNQSPDAVAAVSSNVGIVPATLSFSSAGSVDPDGIIVTRRWNFGDGTPLSLSANPSHTYTSPGNYVATLTVIDDNGAQDVASLNISVLTVNQAPVAVANATPDYGKAPLEVAFSSAGSGDPDGTIVGYEWDFGDGSPSSTDANPTHVYASPGSYTATLTVTDDRTFPAPLTDTATIAVEVTEFNTPPTAVAAVDPATGKVPLPVQFSSAGSGDLDGTIVSYEWDFGDGNTSDEADPSHVYTTAGNFIATLTVTDNDGATAMASVDVERVLNIFPTASATAGPTSGKGPLTVDFDATDSTDADGTIVSYEWDVDDDGDVDATGATASFTYAPGEYTARLTVTDDSGDSDTTTFEIVSLPNVLPVAVANSDVSSGNAPLAVAFTGSSSLDPDGSITGYEWDFGDGSPVATTADASHTYTVEGIYSAVLTVTDSDGETASAPLTIVVNANPAPVAEFQVESVTPVSTKVPVTYTFDASASSDDASIEDYSWDFGDGSAPGTGVNPSHTYTDVGSFVVTLTVTDNGGLTNSSTTSVSTLPNPAPTVVASADQQVGKGPLTVAFSSAGSTDEDGTIDLYEWDFGDGSPVSNDLDPTHVYAVGSYVATLTVTDNDGNESSTTLAIESQANVLPVAVANFTPGKANMKAPLPVTFSSAGSVDNDGAIVAYEWDFTDDGSVDSTDENPSFTYTTDGTKVARLTVTDTDGATDSSTVQVVVGPENVAPVAVPTADRTSGKRDLTVNFSSDSTDSDGTIVAYEWDFGDGSPVATTEDASHTYAVGTWTATLTVTDDEGLTHTAPITINSNPPQAPVAGATATPTSGKRPLVVQFSSASSTDPDDEIVAWAWDFQDDGEVDSTSANPTHTYPQGTYTARLTVTDEEGLTSSTTVGVVSNPNQAPVAVANADVTAGKGPLVVQFSAAGSLDPDDSIIAYQWDFDGVGTSTSQSPTRTFTDPGEYDVTLTVTDEEGVTGTTTVTISVVTDVTYVAETGDDGNLGTEDSPKRTIPAALATAAGFGQSEVRVAAGSYGAFTVVAGIDVIGDGPGSVSVTGGANTPGVTATGASVATTVSGMTIQGGNGSTAAGATGVLAQAASDLTLDDVVVDSGTPSAVGSSAYGVRALGGSTVTVKGSTVTARNGVAGTDGADGTGGTAGTNGNAGVAGANAGATVPGAGVTGTPSTRNGGAGGTGGGGASSGASTGSGSAGGGGAAGGGAGVANTGGGGGGGGGAAGAATAAGTSGSATTSPADVYDGNDGTNGNAGNAGAGGGGGGGGNGTNNLITSGSRRKGGGGGGGGLGGAGGTAGLAGTSGGGSFGIYSHNSTVTVTGTDVITGNGGDGGDGGDGGTGGKGGDGGAGGAAGNYNTGVNASGGGGAGGGAGGRGGSGGGGGAGGPSVGVYSVGSGTQIVSSSSATLGSAGPGGAGGTGGTGGAVGAAGAAGTSNISGRNGASGTAGASGGNGNTAANAANGARSVRVHANQAPTAAAAVDRTTGRAPLEVEFSSAASVDVDGSIVAHSWNFGDGSPVSTDANPTHTYTGAGSFTAVLTVTDDEGATGTSSVVVTPSTNQAPVAVANGTPLRGVFPLGVNFSSAGSIDNDCDFIDDCPGLSYEWNFGDGSPTSSEPNPTHEYQTPDTYTATLTVTDNEGATATATLSVNVRLPNLPPLVAATGDPTSGKEPLVVDFSSAGSEDQEVDGSIVEYEWDFGDGNTSTDANPTHTYTASGEYTATLTVTDNDDATASTTVAITVDANQAPTAVAGSDVTGGHAPLDVAFTSAGSGDPDGTYDIEWDFGDGATSTDANPTHTFTNAGSETITRTVTLTVTDDNGAESVSTLTVDVWPENQAPTADATASPEAGKTPLTVSFDGAGSADADGTVNSYEWDFDDGDTSSDVSPVHEFTAAGTYEVTLTVTDDDGATDTSSVTITVADNVAPAADAAVAPATGKATFTTFEFDGTGSTDSDGTVDTYSWDFGDGTAPVSGASPTHVYAAADTYEVTLTVTDDNGATDTDTLEVVVVDNVAPEAVAGATPTSGKTGITSFAFSSAGSADTDGTVASYSWNFGDGSPLSASPNPAKTFLTAGIYQVELTVTDDNGATDTATVQVTVLDNVAPSTSPTVNLTSGTAGVTNFNFAANAADSDGTVTAYSWNFGDGTFATIANPSNKKFNLPGTYNVTVTVTDNNGAQTTSAPITITIS